MFLTNLRFNYASFAAKDHMITGIEILILIRKSTQCLIEYIKYQYRYYSSVRTCIDHPTFEIHLDKN